MRRRFWPCVDRVRSPSAATVRLQWSVIPVMKSNAQKVRALQNGNLLAGFAGAAADAFTLFEKFEEKLQRYPDNLPRAAVELAKDWRSDRMLRKLEALLIVASRDHGFIISGTGDIIEPDDGILAIGSGGLARSPPPVPSSQRHRASAPRCGACALARDRRGNLRMDTEYEHYRHRTVVN